MRALALICILFLNAASQQVDQPPDFSLPRLDGRILRSPELKSSIVVLDFWATWCEQCVTEIPFYNMVQKKYSLRGVRVLGIAVQSGWATDVKRFAVEHKMRYTILVGNDDTVTDFGVIAFPTTYVIGPGWKIYKKYTGSNEAKNAEIERDIEALLKTK